MNNFKKTILLGGAALCLYPAALFAETCGTTPSCSSLGFTVPAASLSTSCKDKTYLKCPFGDYYFCSVSTACTAANCKTCETGSTTKCAVCDTGYALSALGTCQQLKTCNVLGCQTCVSGNANKCSVCQTNFTLSNGECLLNVRDECNGLLALTCNGKEYCCPKGTTCSTVTSGMGGVKCFMKNNFEDLATDG